MTEQQTIKGRRLPEELREPATIIVDNMLNMPPGQRARIGKISDALRDVIKTNPTYFPTLADPDIFSDFVQKVIPKADNTKV